MRVLGAVPDPDGEWPTVGLVAFKHAVCGGTLLFEEMRTCADADTTSDAFGHALFRWYDRDGDGRLSIDDLVGAMARVREGS
jgi:hypothetical protein